MIKLTATDRTLKSKPFRIAGLKGGKLIENFQFPFGNEEDST